MSPEPIPCFCKASVRAVLIDAVFSESGIESISLRATIEGKYE